MNDNFPVFSEAVTQEASITKTILLMFLISYYLNEIKICVMHKSKHPKNLTQTIQGQE